MTLPSRRNKKHGRHNNDYGLFGPLSPSPFSPFVKSKLRLPRRGLCSLFVISGFGLVICVLCYASYFPTGVVWITTTEGGEINQNNIHVATKTFKSTGSSLFNRFWKFRLQEDEDGTLINHKANSESSSSGGGNDFERTQTLITFEESRKIEEKGTGERRSCNFPRLNPFDPSITEFIKDPPNIDCLTNYPLVFRTNFKNKLIQVNKIENATCCYKTVTRVNESDHNVRYSKKCFPITKTTTEIPPSHEFISLKCTQPVISNTTNKLTSTTVHRDMFAFVHLKPDLESRLTGKVKNHNERGEKLNILILGLDSQSSMNFLRQMPQTYNFLIKNLSSIGLQGYTKVGDNTFPNTVPLLSGSNVQELKKKCWPTKSTYFDDCPFIWKKYSELGYRTSFSEDSIWMGTFNYEKKGFMNPPTDYYLHPLSLLMAKKIGHETWGNAKLCYGPRLAFEVLLDYIVKTAVTFNSNDDSQPHRPYFQYVWANSLFHDYLNNPKLGDEILYLTLDYLKRHGHLNNTVLVLLSDHGIRWGSIRSTINGKIEERMPMAYFSFPEWFRNKYKNGMHNFKRNAGFRLTTPFDIYETLLDMMNLKGLNDLGVDLKSKSKKQLRGISLFKKIGADRTCKSAGIEEHWCVCNSLLAIDKNSSLVRKAADFIIDKINQALFKFRGVGGQCAKLNLYKINEAMRKIDGDIDRGVDIDIKSDISSNLSAKETEGDIEDDSKSTRNSSKIQLQITLVAKPGFGVFECTVYGNFEGSLWNISGEISRLNLYREQSLCIRDYIAQKYCFCLDQRDGDDDESGNQD